MNSLWQAPIVVVALITWLNATPTSFADAAQREALRRQLVPKPTRQLTNLNLPASAFVRDPDSDAAPPTPVVATGVTTNEDGAPAGLQGKVDGVQVVVPPAAPAQAPAAAASARESSDEKSQQDERAWRNRYAAAKQKLEDDQNLAAALQTRISSLTTDAVNRDDPAQRAKLADDRRKAMDQLDRMQKQIVADQKAIDQVQEDARRQGIPPGWVR